MKKMKTGLFDLNGKVAIVTGGNGGIGLGMARGLAEAGAAIAVVGRNEAKSVAAVAELQRAGARAIPVATDVTDKEAVTAMVERVQGEFGRIDILVNNAGIAGVNKTVADLSYDEWRQVMTINLDGPFLCCKAVVPTMMKQNYGRIVNIASIAGKEGNPNASHYSASKAGVIALTKSLGKELAGTDIAVNAVTPAAAKTAIFDQMTQQHIDFMLSKIPRGRFLKVEELAALVTWMASEECLYTTGAVFDISGGRATY
jgi:3-oxoacyl-[acyl-carrier protein] reductase